MVSSLSVHEHLERTEIIDRTIERLAGWDELILEVLHLHMQPPTDMGNLELF